MKKVNADFSKRILVHSGQSQWIASPMQGVHRRPLDRVSDEIARATSIVRYSPGSRSSPHVHTGAEVIVTAGPGGAGAWLKSGYLAEFDDEIRRVTAAQP